MAWRDSPYINHFVQPDTIIAEQGNPQSWNRYAYVQNNPILYNDPTGHRESCEDGDSCQHSFSTAVKNVQYQNECGAGKRKECAGGTKTGLGYFAVGVVTAGLADYLLLGGGLADAMGTGLYELGSACIQSAACRWVTGMAGGLDTIHNAASANNSGLRVFDSEAKGPISSYQVTVIGKNPGYVQLGNDLNANALDAGHAWTPEVQSAFEQGVIARQDLVVLASDERTETFGQEVSTFIANGFADAVRMLIPPAMQQ